VHGATDRPITLNFTAHGSQPRSRANMKLLASVLLLAAVADAFVANTVAKTRSSALGAYVPDGLTPEQYKKLKEKEASKKVGNFDGLSGAQFRSRSMAEYQKGREAGTLQPNMPMKFVLQKLNAGQIRPIDIPYMQRPRGKPDNSDLKPNGFWAVAPKGYSGPGVTAPVPGARYKGSGAGRTATGGGGGGGGGFKLPWQK